MYYALNQELGVDPGRAVSQAYRLPVHRDWYRSTVSHNAVLVDRKPQRPASGLAELFAESDSMAVASAYTVEAYPGIRQHRLLVLRPGFLIVADVMVGMDGNSHTYDWVYHNRGHRITCNAVSTASEDSPLRGFEYVTDARQGDTDHMIRAMFEWGQLRIALTMNSSRGTKVLTGMGIGESSNDRVPMLCVTRTGRNALFAAVIDPIPAHANGEVEVIEVRPHETIGYYLHLRLNDGSEEVYSYDPTGRNRNVQGFHTESTLLCLKRTRASIHYSVFAEFYGRMLDLR